MQPLYELEPLEELDEQEKFLSILYHDAQGGNAIRMVLGEGTDKPYVRHFANKDCQKIGYRASTYNAYVTINTFKSYRRIADEVFNYGAIFIDLDGHNYKTEQQLDQAIQKTKDKLKKLYETNKISAPTMITYTGRGLGLFYVLNKSIANIAKNKKSIKFLDDVREALTAKYRKLLAGTGLLEVDSTVKDAARVCRLPLTMNKKCNRWCRLIHIEYVDDEVAYYDLKKLANDNHLFDEINAVRKTLRTAKVVSIDAYRLPFLTLRVQKMEKLQELREYDCQGYREYMAFIYYNAAKQVYGAISAEGMLEDYNKKFKNPLGVEELVHIKAVVDKNVAPTKTYEGFYKLPDAWIIETLEVTDRENSICMFGSSKRQIERQRTKENNAKKRAERNQEIADYIIAHPEQTYPVIAEFFGVSKAKISLICKEFEIKRHNNAKIDTKIAESLENTEAVESSKNLSESLLGVPFSRGTVNTNTIETVAESLKKFEHPEIVEQCLMVYQEHKESLKRKKQKRQMLGQIAFKLGADGNLVYYECS